MARTHPSELLVRQRFGALTRAWPAAQQGDVESLHAARVATRRLREALPLLATGKRRRKLESDVQRITRAIGPVRELDVAMQILDEIRDTDDAPRAAVVRLRQAVVEERQGLHVEMCRRLKRCDLDKLRKRAIAGAKKRAGGPASEVTRTQYQLTAARDRAARRAERLRVAMETAAGIYLPDRLHAVRIAVKKLRYALEVASVFGRSRAGRRLLTLKKAQDLLGRMHDLEVLIARTRGIQGSATAPTLKLSADLDRLVRGLETECRQLHGHYMASRKALLSLCDQVGTGAKGQAAPAA